MSPLRLLPCALLLAPLAAGATGFGDDGEPDPFAADGESEVPIPFESEPPGATVLLDGNVLCERTPCRENVETGMHLVVMTKAGCAEGSEIITFYPTTKVRFVLASAPGRLELASTPAGQPVLVDGVARGRTPTGLDVTAGTHELRFGDECFVPATERVTVREGEKRNVTVRLEPRTAQVKITAEEIGGPALEGTVAIDGVAAGRVPGTLKVALCARRVEVTARGERWEGALALDPSRTTEVVARFAAPPVETWGTLVIEGVAGRATEASIDSGGWIALPSEPVRVRSGPHTVACRVDGLGTGDRSIDVPADQQRRVSCPAPPVRRETPPPPPVVVAEETSPSVIYARFGAGPAIGVFGAGLELDVGSLGLTIGSGALVVAAGVSLNFGPTHDPGKDGAFVEAHWARMQRGVLPVFGDETGFFSQGGSMFGVTGGWNAGFGFGRVRLGAGFARTNAGTSLLGELSADFELGRW